MRPEPYLSFAGVEIANGNRTLSYLAALGGSNFDVPIISGKPAAYCSAIGGTFVSPSADPAPWYSNAASAEFLGLYASDIEIQPVAKRAVTDKQTGATVGSLRAGKRVITVTGQMLATSARGMKFGEDWLTQKLAGSEPGCSDDSLVIMRACETAGYETLQQVGLVDGPVPSPIGQIAECVMEQISFQLVAGWPYLIGATSVLTPATVITSGVANKVCGTITGAAGKTTAGKLTIVAGSANVTGLEIFGEPCAGYVDAYPSLYDPYLAGSGTIVDLLVGTLPAGSTFVLDGITHTATLTDSTGRVIGGLDVLTPIGPFRWSEVTNGAVMCLCVVAGTVNAGTTVKVESADLSL